MIPFSGFSSSTDRAVPVPLEVFTELLAQIKDTPEWQVLLYSFWYLSRLEQKVKFIPLAAFVEDKIFFNGMDSREKEKIIKSSLDDLVSHGIFLCYQEHTSDPIYFINSKDGRAALEAVKRKLIQETSSIANSPSLETERLNIFSLYEQNIGPLTPLIAETLQDAEKTYPADWITEAIKTAVKNNVRRWKYIEAILIRWKEEGRYEKDRRDLQDDRKKYIDGEFGDLIEH